MAFDWIAPFLDLELGPFFFPEGSLELFFALGFALDWEQYRHPNLSLSFFGFGLLFVIAALLLAIELVDFGLVIDGLDE
jgi:hypothetical protein